MVHIPNAAPSNGSTAGGQGPLLQARLSVAGTERVMFLSDLEQRMARTSHKMPRAWQDKGSFRWQHLPAARTILLAAACSQFSFMPVTGSFENFLVFPFSTTLTVQPNYLSRHHRLCCQFISLCRPRHPPIQPFRHNSPVGRAPRSLTRFFRARHDGIRLPHSLNLP